MEETITAIDLAPLHGTVLSIFIGVFAAYSINLFTRLDELRVEIFHETNRINQLPNPGFSGSTQIARDCLKGDLEWDDLKNKFTKLAMGVPLRDGPISGGERGAELLEVLSTIVNLYPLPQYLKSNDNNGIRIGAAEPMTFDSIDEVEKWVDDINNLARTLTWAVNTHRGKIREMLIQHQDNLSEQNKLPDLPDQARQHMSEGQIEDLNRTMNQTDDIVLNQFNSFINVIQQAQQIAQQLNNQLEKYRTTRARTPSKSLFFTTIGLTAIAFLFGVILPMFSLELPPILWKGIPTAVYFGFFALVVIKVWRL